MPHELDTTAAQHTANAGVQLLIAACKAAGIDHYVIAPGSRSAPLVIEIIADSQNKTTVIADERCAGYYALGMAQQLRKPVALVCTSGTAVLNLAPAICEAYYQKIPLVALTADRPRGAAEQGENQALLHQENFFEKFIYCNTDYDTSQPVSALKRLSKKIFQQIAFAAEQQEGPVHINVRMDEPLYEYSEQVIPPPSFLYRKPTPHYEKKTSISTIRKNIQNSTRRLVVAGCMHADPHLQAWYNQIIQDERTALITEPLSNYHHPHAIAQAEYVLAATEKPPASLMPDLVVTTGYKVLSKQLNKFIRSQRNIPHVHIAAIQQKKLQLIYNQSLKVTLHTDEWFRWWYARNLLAPSHLLSYRYVWENLSESCRTITEDFLSKAPYSDATVIRYLLHHVPEGACVHLGNSTVVRYAGITGQNHKALYFGNRGASGIDGCLSAAAGAAHIHKGITLCILGDVSFFYDSNALWNNQLSPMLRIVIINNGGGNIFRWLERAERIPGFENLFETKHQLTASHIARMYNLPYYHCTQGDELPEMYRDFLSERHGSAVILEVTTNNKTSANVFKQYIHTLKSHRINQNE
ncbi:MAG: 2-succinyl-5-enolpyruvyl-6-hydroxy-3-cyclohexene-1-carboxylic-acid synthase [Chitinophagales bacterium]|nr:2-succinyl-5-enolpyruvyl-6-hydroxy-3-cyclohexene-1-carboxylic-acid synthase [Chitinophagales bacterium]MDW8419886.1 2-succinyl-5-enolpyruvyl-6-hydroxy-3-cyclohexene-1-carboxylic-acid synthase [Chitinophagales bacterium]